MFDLNGIYIYMKVVESGSFMGAARNTGIPKSTIARKMNALEDSLGVRLLQRDTRRLQLTEAGQNFYERTVRIMADIEEAEASVTTQQGEPSGTLRVTASAMFGERFLSPILPAYLKEYPKVKVELFLTNRTVDLIGEELDLALRIGMTSSHSLIVRKLSLAPLYLCASPSYIEKYGRPQEPQALLEHNCLVYAPQRTIRPWSFQKEGQGEVSVQVGGSLLANSYPVLLDALMQDVGIGYLPGVLCSQAIREERLIHLLPDWSNPLDWFVALYPSRTHLSAKVRSFLDFLLKRCAVLAWSLDDPSASEGSC